MHSFDTARSRHAAGGRDRRIGNGSDWLRRFGAGLMSWLCCSSGLAAQLPIVPAPTPAPRERIDAVLQKLDERFARGDVAGYVATFLPDHPGCHAMLRMQLERMVAATPQRQRTSTILTEPRVIGPRTVVRVRHDVHLQQPGGAQPSGAPSATMTEHSVFAFATRADGAIVPTFCVGIPTDSTRNPDQARPLSCPPCNYQIGGIPGWLCVPMLGEQANALESASLFLLGTNLACDVSVEIEPEPQRALTLVTELGAALVSLDPGARAGKAEPWVPPAHRERATDQLDGSRLEVELPTDFPHAGGGRAVFHVTTFGGLQHLLLLRGSAAALREHTKAVQALLGSYRVLQLDGDVARAASEALGHHTGGVCDGATYRNDRYRVVLEGPDGWKLQQRTGGPVFRVVWTSPAGSRLWLTAHRVPAAMAQWTKATADLWIEQLCEQQGLVPDASAPAPAWQPLVECGADTRTLRLQPKVGAPRSHPRRLRVMRFDDLLLIADGLPASAAEDAELSAALASLRRNL